jgi:2-oxoglutarate dehydrogenase E2 component (dihydrolipoamide succinyltransferase)
VTARRVLTIGGAAAIGMLAFAALAAPAAALPAAAPVVPAPPLAPPALVTRAIDGVVAAADTTLAPAPLSPAVPETNMPDLSGASDAAGRTALAPAPDGTPLTKGHPSPPAVGAQPSRVPTPRAPRAGRADERTRAGWDAPAREPVTPAIGDEAVTARPVGVTGALDLRSHSSLGSTLGTAAASLAWWGALCVLAFAARLVAISAWRDAQRRRRVLSPR